MAEHDGAGARRLPEPFSDLEVFVDDWALPTEQARFGKRLTSTLDEVRYFNDTIHPRMHDIIGYLNQFPLDAMPPEEHTLLDLARSYMETSHPIDLGWKTIDLEDAFDPSRFTMREPSR